MKDFAIFGLNYFVLGLMISTLVSIYPPIILLLASMLLTSRVYADMRTGEKYEHLMNVKSDELEDFVSKLGEDRFSIKKSVRESGAVIHRFKQPNIYIVPSHTNPEDATDEAKAVLSHEYSHVTNLHKIKSILYDTTAVCLNGFVLGFSTATWIIPVFILNSFILLPLIKNYLNHQFEYTSDQYAVENVNIRAVQNRLRRNSHLQDSSDVPYGTTHPSVQTRMNRINNNNKEMSKDKSSTPR